MPADSAPFGGFFAASGRGARRGCRRVADKCPAIIAGEVATVGDAGALPFRLVAIRVADAFVMLTVGDAGAFGYRKILPTVGVAGALSCKRLDKCCFFATVSIYPVLSTPSDAL